MARVQIREGKYTIETFAKERRLTPAAALNLLSRLRHMGFVQTSGGGQQKRMYTVTKTPQLQTNGFYDVINKYSPEKIVPKFRHRVVGRYTIEQAIIDGIRIGDVRTLEATMHLFFHVNDWKRLFDLAKKHDLTSDLKNIYNKARTMMKVRRMPQRYQ